MGHWWKDTDREKPYMPLCPSQIPHGQAWKQTQASTMTRRQVTEIEGKLATHRQTIAENFNTYYISVADNITNNSQTKSTIDNSNKKTH